MSTVTGFLTDSTLCIGCKACEVACKEWNDLGADGLNWSGFSYDNTGALGHSTWRHVKFVEHPPELGHGGNSPELASWTFSSDVCKHCENAGCLEACPTGAITAPHKLDARRCISYLTIELKSSIPLDLRPLIGDRIFGCDDCLDACPWNRFAQVSRESAFAARSPSRTGTSTTAFSLRDYLALTETQFRDLFRNSPIKRIKRRGFLRNVCVALGNVGTSEDLPALRAAELDSEPLIAEHAAWAIEQILERAKSKKKIR